MNELDFDRTARLWLDDGPSQMPDRALDAALATVHRTRQRRAFWPAWMDTRMPSLIRLSAVAAVVLIAVIGISLLPGGGIGQPVPTPSPTPVPSLPSGNDQPLQAGTYAATDPFPVPLTVTVPAGWSGVVGGPYAVFLYPTTGTGEVGVVSFDSVYGDPCHGGQGLIVPRPGGAVNDLVTALQGNARLTVSPVTDITISGRRAKELTITAPASLAGCHLEAGNYRLWELPLGATNDLAAGEREKLRVIDIDGTRYVIYLTQLAGQTPAETAEFQAVMDSIQIAP